MKVMVVLGTRPEAVKLAPLIAESRRRPQDIELVICSTGQHREMLTQTLASFGLNADINLDIMQPEQTLSSLTAKLVGALDGPIGRYKPEAILVQGDTTSAMAAALVAFYHHVPVGHVEAGLRTGNLSSPFPEELNRVLVARMARWHFAPTPIAASNLCREGVGASEIFVTGNTVVDAIALVRDRWGSGFLPKCDRPFPGHRLVFITAHRRESHGDGFRRVCAALRLLCGQHPDLGFVFPVHLNPQVRRIVHTELAGLPNMALMEPVDFETSLFLQSESCLAITDSGGIQEEAPSFGLPTVVIRQHTERGEGVTAGFSTLAGTETHAIVRAANAWLADEPRCQDLHYRPNPYGDGLASARIINILLGMPIVSFRSLDRATQS